MIYGILSLLVTGFLLINQIAEDIPEMKLRMAYNQEGRQSFTIILPTEETVNKLRNDKHVNIVGSMCSYGTDIRTGLEFIYEDENYQECFQHKYDNLGNSNEILVSKKYYEKHGCQIGDHLETVLSKNDADGGTDNWAQNFVIAGYNDCIPENRVIVSERFFEEYERQPDQAAVILLDNSNIEGVVQSFVHEYHITGRVRINEAITEAIKYKEEISKNSVLIQLFLMVFLIFLSTYLLNGVFNKRRTDIGIMRSIGLKMKVIYLEILLEGMCYIFFPVMVGGLVTKKIDLKNIIVITFVMFMAIIPSIFRFLFLVRRESPINIVKNIRFSVDNIFLKRWFSSVKMPVMVKYSLRNMGRKPFKTLFTIMMLVFSMSFICAIYAYFGTERSYEWIRNYIPGDAVVTDQGMESLAMPSDVFDEKTVDHISEMGGIKTVDKALLKECNLYLPSGQINKESGLYEEEFDNNGKIGYFAANFVAFGINSLERHFNGCKYETEHFGNYSEDVKSHLNFSNKHEFSTLHCVISPELAEFGNVRAGSHMAIEFAYQSENNEWIQNVADVVVVNVAEENPAISLESEGILPHIYFELSELQELTESAGVNRLDVMFSDNYDRSQVLGELRNITLDSYVINVTDYQEYYTLQKTDDFTSDSLKRIVGVLCSFLMIICCVDIIYTGIMNRKEELSLLHLIGIKKSSIESSLLLESLLYSLWSLLFLIPIEAILVLANYYLFNQVSVDTNLIKNYIAFDVMMLSINFLIAVVVVWVQLKNIDQY